MKFMMIFGNSKKSYKNEVIASSIVLIWLDPPVLPQNISSNFCSLWTLYCLEVFAFCLKFTRAHALFSVKQVVSCVA